MPKHDKPEPPQINNLFDLIAFAGLRSAMTGLPPFEALKGQPCIVKVKRKTS